MKYFYRSCSKLRPWMLLHRRHRQTKGCRTRSDIPNVLVMSAEACCEILQCIHRRLIHKRFQLVPEEKIQHIEVRGSWTPSNIRYFQSISRDIIKVATHRNRKMCWYTIMREIYVLVNSGCCFIKPVQENVYEWYLWRWYWCR